MSKQIDPIKKLKYKQNRLQGNSIAKSLIYAGAKPTTAYHDAKNQALVKACEAELKREIEEADVTIKVVLNNLFEDRELARKKNDIATMKEVDALLGKYLAMFDKSYIKAEIINKEEIEKRLLERFSILN